MNFQLRGSRLAALVAAGQSLIASLACKKAKQMITPRSPHHTATIQSFARLLLSASLASLVY